MAYQSGGSHGVCVTWLFICELVQNFPNQSRRAQWLPNEQAPRFRICRYPDTQICIGIWPMTTSIVLKSVRGSRLEHFRAKVSGLAARSSMLLVRAKFSPRLLHGLLLFLSFLPLPLLATVINEQQMLWVWLKWLKTPGNGWLLAEACQGNAFKPVSFSFTFTFTFTFTVFISIKTNHTENVILQKGQSKSAPGIVNILFRFLSHDSLPSRDISKASAVDSFS